VESYAAPRLWPVAVTGACVSLVVFHSLWLWFAYRHTGPLAPTSRLTNLQTLRSTSAPELVLLLARRVHAPGGSFRIALPWGATVVVVIDPSVARLVLLQPSSGDRSHASAHLGAYACADSATQGRPVSKLARARAAPAFTLDRMTGVPSLAARYFGRLRAASLDQLAAGTEQVALLPIAERLATRVAANVALEYELTDEELETFLRNVTICEHEHEAAQSLSPCRALCARCSCAAARARAEIHALSWAILSHHRASKHSRPDERSLVALIEECASYASDAERQADISMFLVAAAGLTASTIAWALYDLAAHPEEQRSVAAELRAGTPAAKSVALSNAVHESMRLNPGAAGGIHRTTARAIPLRNGGHIPSGAQVFIPLLALHRSPALGSPDRYAPARWERGGLELREHFMPFGNGQRGCIAQSLASALAHEAVGLFVKHFWLELVLPPVPITRAVRRPEGGRVLVHHDEPTGPRAPPGDNGWALGGAALGGGVAPMQPAAEPRLPESQRRSSSADSSIFLVQVASRHV